jgi:hypothetical protein
MKNEIGNGHDYEKVSNQIDKESLADAEIHEYHFELKQLIEEWMKKFPAAYWEEGTLVFLIKNDRVARSIHASIAIDTAEIIKIMAPDL